jgi:hypothetical protein
MEDGRSRRNGTVWRRRSLGLPAAGKTWYGGFLESIPAPNTFCGPATRSLCPTHPSPSWYPVIDMLPHAVCLGLSYRHTVHKGGMLIKVEPRSGKLASTNSS